MAGPVAGVAGPAAGVAGPAAGVTGLVAAAAGLITDEAGLVASGAAALPKCFELEELDAEAGKDTLTLAEVGGAVLLSFCNNREAHATATTKKPRINALVFKVLFIYFLQQVLQTVKGDRKSLRASQKL